MQQHVVSPVQWPLATVPCQALLRTSGRAQLLRRSRSKAANSCQSFQRDYYSTLQQYMIHEPRHPSSKCRSCRKAARHGVVCSAFASESTVATRTTSEWAQVPHQYQNKTYLQELRAQDFALVRDGAVQFRPGLNAISGESGAGKSVLLGALLQLLGAPADADCVRHGADLAAVEGRWWLNSHMAQQVKHEMRKLMLPSKALPAAVGGVDDGGGGGYLHIKRELVKSDDGTIRSRVLINNCPSSLRVLRVLGTLLVDVNAQHASLALREGQQQLQLLDRIAGSTHLVQQLSLCVSRLAELEAQLSKADALSDEAERQTLEEDVERIDNARLQPDEEGTLRRRLSALQSRKTNLETAAIAQASLQGEYSEGGQSLLDAARLLKSQVRSVLSAEQEQHRLLLAQKQQHKQAVEDSSSSAAPAAEDDELDIEVQAAAAAISTLEAAVLELEDMEECVQAASSQLQQYAAAAGYPASEATTITKRLEQLTRLCRRFGVRTTSELLELADEWSEQLDAYYDNLDKQEVWRAEATTLQQDITLLASQLSSSRVAAAAALSAAVEGCFDQLAMSSSRFLVDLRWRRSHRAQPCSRAVLMPAKAEPTPAHQRKPLDTYCTSSSNGGGSVTDMNSRGTTSSSGGSSSCDSNLYDLSATGLDHVEFLLSAGPSEPLRSLATVASGGEAARVMLALKAAPAAAAAAAASNGWRSGFAAGELDDSLGGAAQPADLLQEQAVQQAVGDVSHHGAIQQVATQQGSIQQQQQQQHREQKQQQRQHKGSAGSFSIGPPVVVMDETDAGVGARLGDTVGRLLRDMTVGTHPAAQQLIVVSHTPQVAAHAAHHIKVSKATSDADGRVITTFNALESHNDRQVELADMMGRPGDSQALGFAAAMLAAAHAHDRN